LPLRTTYLLSRRVLGRQFLLSPDAAITGLIIYALAVSSRRFGIQVHAICAMSSHLHLVVTDMEGRLPRFLQRFHRLVALGTKVLRKWEGPVWEPGAVSAVRLLTPAAVREKIAYVLANPVAAGLVQYAHEWPGAKVLVADIGGGALRASRPTAYFNPKNPGWPEHAELSITLPPDVKEDNAEDFRLAVAAELARLEAAAHESMRQQGLGFLGAGRPARSRRRSARRASRRLAIATRPSPSAASRRVLGERPPPPCGRFVTLIARRSIAGAKTCAMSSSLWARGGCMSSTGRA
jgi:hypothetical protein